MNIEAILKAAEYLDRKEREAEHGYAMSRYVEYIPRRRLSTSAARITRSSTVLMSGLRSSHNELEKNRRAHLRNCLERLKALVPVGPECTRHTTLGLLTDAKQLIQSLEAADSEQQHLLHQLRHEQRQLRTCLDKLSTGQYRVHSLSECSDIQSSSRSHSLSESSCISSQSVSSLSPSEHDDVDIVGSSDVDEQQTSLYQLQLNSASQLSVL